MPNLKWYWHRLRAMGPSELALRLRKKFFEFSDAKPTQWPELNLEHSVYPKLPSVFKVPGSILEAVKYDADRISSGKIRFFGHLDMKVDSPPLWNRDYQSGINVETDKIAFKLDHRELPFGAAIKPLWEPSRWYGPVRLAQACWLHSNNKYGELAIEWLEDWVNKNPPFIGWHWTSALESGMRLIAFTWIDAFLTAYDNQSDGSLKKRLYKLRKEILLPHVWYTWRHRSFGSSANNHLLGELSGLAIAVSRWPNLSKLGPDLENLSKLIERETLIQFNPDGGNFEQGLNYHFYSWEFCWESRQALNIAGALHDKRRDRIDNRLLQAAYYFKEIQVSSAPWDYGDSDSAYVLPWFLKEQFAATEWMQWLAGKEKESVFYHFMRGEFKDCVGTPEPLPKQSGWRLFPDTGFLVKDSGKWKARVDISPLGSGSMAAHGHLDAQHISLWLNGEAMIIDPGTGDYHGNPNLRNWLASRDAHNGPCSKLAPLAERKGLFLWSNIHPRPLWSFNGDILETEVRIGESALTRTIKPLDGVNEGWMIRDFFEKTLGELAAFSVRWQFSPDCKVESIGDSSFRVESNSTVMVVELGTGWHNVELCKPDLDRDDVEMDTIVSPRFMETNYASCLKLSAKPGKGSDFTTLFKVE